jgi:hypothetical protein
VRESHLARTGVEVGQTELTDAAIRGDVRLVKQLLDEGTADDWDSTPLLYACYSEPPCPEVVALLRERGADPYYRNRHGDAPRRAAYSRYQLSGYDPLSDLPAPDPRSTEAGELSEEEMDVVVEAVHAITYRDEPALRRMKAYEYGGGDPYMWTVCVNGHRPEQLITPPGDPRSWSIMVNRINDGPIWVGVDMWNIIGLSDMTLKGLPTPLFEK